MMHMLQLDTQGSGSHDITTFVQIQYASLAPWSVRAQYNWYHYAS